MIPELQWQRMTSSQNWKVIPQTKQNVSVHIHLERRDLLTTATKSRESTELMDIFSQIYGVTPTFSGLDHHQGGSFPLSNALNAKISHWRRRYRINDGWLWNCNSQILTLFYYLLYFLYIEDRKSLVRDVSHTLSLTHESLPPSSLPRSSFSTTFPFYNCNYFYLVKTGPESPLLRLRRRRILDPNCVINSSCSLSSFLQLSPCFHRHFSLTDLDLFCLLSKKDWSSLHFIQDKLIFRFLYILFALKFLFLHLHIIYHYSQPRSEP